jgi:spore germination protein KB
MNNKATVTSVQLIAVLLIFRLAFGLNFIAGINPGTSVQDILLAVPVIFVINLIIALPIFMLLKRHPGKDLIECSVQIFGNGLGFIISFIYFCFFIYVSSLQLGTFQMFYNTCVITQTSALVIAIPILIVCIYGVIKGIESITRFSILVFIFYIIVMTTIFISTISNVNLSYLKPIFYEGPKYFLQAVLVGVNSSFQILFLAMCVPFLKPGTKIVKSFITWNALSMLILFVIEFFVITNMGPFASKQIFPIITLAVLSKISVLERIDSFHMISWIFNSTLNICIGLFVASQCLMRTSLRKWRRTIITISGLLILIFGSLISTIYLKILNLYGNSLFTATIIILIIAVPLIILITDVVKGKVAEDEEIS